MELSRRHFLVTAAGGIGFGLGAFSHQFPLPPPQMGPDWRPGVETFVPSTCLLCPAHCGIRARLVDGALTRIDGNPLHPVSQGGLCPKGRAGIQLVYHPGRLRGPMQRVGPAGSHRYEPIAWDAAIERIVAALRSAQERGQAAPVEWLVGNVTGLMADVVTGFCHAYGTDRITVDDYRDGSADVMRLCQGIDAPPAFDLAESDLVLSFGAALSEAWWALPQAARARENDPGRSPRWIQIDARLSRTAVSADRWVAIRPGTYGILAMGLAYVMAKEGLYDAETVSRRVSGWEDWVDETGTRHEGFRTLVLRHGRPDDVSARTGVPVAQVFELAKNFGRARTPVAIWDQTVAWRTNGLSDALAIHALNILAGRLNRPGGVLVQTPVSLPGPLGEAPATDADLVRRPLTSTTWPAADGRQPASILFLYQSNPVASAARSEDARQALSRVPLVVSFSPFLDESARCAHLVLPDHTYLERWQDAPAPAAVAFPVWGVVQPVMKPIHDTRATGDVILDIASRLGGRTKAWARWSTVEEIVRERGVALAGARRGSPFVEPFRQSELRELERRGWWLPHGQSPEEHWKTIQASGGWFDPIYDYHDSSGITQHGDGRVWIFPAGARRRLQTSPAGSFLPAAEEPSSRERAGDYPLRLIPYRVLTLASGGTALMPWLLEHLGLTVGHSWETWAEVNAETARTLGLQSGQRVRVESVHGSFDATLRVFPGAQPGAVNVPYGLHTRADGWGEPRGANPLAAVGQQVDAVTGLPDWYSTRVRLTGI